MYLRVDGQEFEFDDFGCDCFMWEGEIRTRELNSIDIFTEHHLSRIIIHSVSGHRACLGHDAAFTLDGARHLGIERLHDKIKILQSQLPKVTTSTPAAESIDSPLGMPK